MTTLKVKFVRKMREVVYVDVIADSLEDAINKIESGEFENENIAQTDVIDQYNYGIE